MADNQRRRTGPSNGQIPPRPPMPNTGGLAEVLGGDKQKQIAEVLQKVLGLLNQHKPIIKSLKDIDIVPRIAEVDGQQCLVIPVTELMAKEYVHMAGVTMGDMGLS